VVATSINASSTISTTGSYIVLGANTYAGTGVKSISITAQYPSIVMYDASNTFRYSIASSNSGITEYYSAQHKFYNMSGTLNPLLLNAVGGVQTLNTIGVGAATPSASGAGITFPATQSASTDANTLDDYEEGTWTPLLKGSTSGSASVAGNGYYTKIGWQVTLQIVYINVSTASLTGDLSITGAPFSSTYRSAGACLPYNMNFSTGTSPSLFIDGANIYLLAGITSAGWAFMTSTGSASVYLVASITYVTS
jgi:hypothetical protein